MKFGLFGEPGNPDELFEAVETAEQGGFDYFGLWDSQSIFREVLTSLGSIAPRVDSMTIGPAVTNPVIRHPAVLASAIATVDDLAGGNAALGIGTGHTAVERTGNHPARLRDLEEAINAIRNLTRGEVGTYKDSSTEIEWIDQLEFRPEIPIYMAAEGPKSQRLAGRVADGAVVNGPHPSIVRAAVEQVAAGAAKAGRDIDCIEIWVKTRANVAPDHDTAVEEAAMTLADYAAVRLKSGIGNKDVPAEYEPRLQRFIDEFESHTGSTHNQELLDELELTEFFAERYGIVGTPAECVEQLQALSELDGVTGVWMSTVQRQPFIDRMAESVIPEL